MAQKTLPSLHQLLVDELFDIYSAERQLIEALPKAAKAASAPKLKEAILHHLEETKQQAKRLEKIFGMLGEKRGNGTYCEAMEGLIHEADEAIEDYPKSFIRDAALICAAQKIEHYEIAAYGTAKAHAKQLDLDEVASLLDETLDEEGNADRTLTKIAEGSFFSSGVNKRAQDENEEGNNKNGKNGNKKNGRRKYA